MSDNKSLASTITDALNNFSFDKKAFCDNMSHEHRYLQNEFTDLCVKWLEFCASDNYRYDGRNEASHRIGKMFMEIWNR